MKNRLEAEKKQKKNDQKAAAKADRKPANKTFVFIKTFLLVFLVTIVIATPLFATVSEVLEINPGDEDAPVLAEEMDMNVLIPTDSPFFEAFTTANRVNILLMGVDHHNLTDTIILASFDMDLKHVDLIWIPRDTYYFRGQGYGDRAHHKINAVYQKNPVNTAMAVSEILMNIPINYYALVTYEGVAEIIDEMGGVPMDVPFHMRYNDPLDRPPLYIDIPAGPQVLNGEKSVQFLRFRAGYPDADLGRIKAQQEFVKSAARQCLSLDLPNIVRTVFEKVNSDISLRTALYLATKAIGMNPEDVRTYQMPGTVRGSFVQPDKQGIADMLTEIYSMEAVVIEEDDENENGEID